MTARGGVGIASVGRFARLLAHDRSFLIGLAIRLILLVVVTPSAHLFAAAPFLTEGFSLTPWSDWLASGGEADAFAAGLPTIVALAPGAWLGAALGAPALALGIAILAWDIAGYALLRRCGPEERRHEVAALYWLSPAAIVLIYWFGVLAVVPVALLLGGFVALEARRTALAGGLAGLAVAAEPVLVLLVPLVVLYAFSLARLRTGAVPLVIGLAAGALVPTLLCLPGFGFWTMVLGSVAMADAVGLVLPFGDTGLAVLPLVLVGVYYAAWRSRLIDDALLWTFATLALLALVALGHVPPAATLVMLALLASHSAYAERAGRLLFGAISAALIVWLLLFEPGAVVAGRLSGTPFAAWLNDPAAAALDTLATTLVAGIALVIAVQIFARGVFRSPTFLASRRPIAVAVAGDSGVGKDTLVDSIAALFSPRVVAGVSGDDYHLWDRNKPMWRALTHLNPKANDLTLFGAHVTDLIDRRWVRARHYDHATGRMTKPLLIRPGELVLASGLHALWSPSLNALFDLRIYLDMDEALRRFLKIRRDVTVRGHPLERVVASIAKRWDDTVAFIHPQKAAAHLVFRLEPRRAQLPDLADPAVIPLRLVVDAVPGTDFDPLARLLVALCGIQATELPLPGGSVRLIVEGDPTVADIAAAARRLTPSVQQLLRAAPGWEPGLKGVMQLVVLDQIEQIRRRRSVNA